MIVCFNNGLGDQVQAIPIAKELLKKREYKGMKVVTKFPQLWEGICETTPWYPGCKKDKRFSYIGRRVIKETTQFQDVCIMAGLKKDLSPQLDWKVKNHKLIGKIKEDAFFAGKDKICLFKYPYKAMDQGDRFKEIVPQKEPFEKIIKRFKHIHFVNIDELDTEVTDVLDLASSVDYLLAQIGHFLPLADAFNKPALIIFARPGLTSKVDFVKGVQPYKFINKKSTITCIDDEDVVAKFKEMLNVC